MVLNRKQLTWRHFCCKDLSITPLFSSSVISKNFFQTWIVWWLWLFSAGLSESAVPCRHASLKISTKNNLEAKPQQKSPEKWIKKAYSGIVTTIVRRGAQTSNRQQKPVQKKNTESLSRFDNQAFKGTLSHWTFHVMSKTDSISSKAVPKPSTGG